MLFNSYALLKLIPVLHLLFTNYFYLLFFSTVHFQYVNGDIHTLQAEGVTAQVFWMEI